VNTNTLVVGDVHGCADELDELLQRAGPDRVVMVGDLFTKGPWPLKVWTLLRELLPDRLASVVGNHDDRLLQAMSGRRPTDKRAHQIIAQLDRADPAWSTWLRSVPLFQTVGDYVVVHAGLHPSGDLGQTTRALALDLRRWPDEKSHQPFWWQIYEGTQPVIFGHDSRRGLVRVLRDDRPFLVGLDTGCVYGGQLSGWFPDQDRLVQVQARKTYR
jgi:predicted phosphodiesterase